MEQHLPTTLQAALYVASAAVILWGAVLVVLLIQMWRQIERVAGAVEKIQAEVTPLAQEARALVGSLRELSGRIERQWTGVEDVINTAQSWSRRANHLMSAIDAVVQAPIFVAQRNTRIVKRGLATFAQALLGRRSQHQPKARTS